MNIGKIFFVAFFDAICCEMPKKIEEPVIFYGFFLTTPLLNIWDYRTYSIILFMSHTSVLRKKFQRNLFCSEFKIALENSGSGYQIRDANNFGLNSLEFLE